jgi:transposase
MRLETCIRKGLGLKAHRVREVLEEEGRLVAVIERIPNRLLKCSRCSRWTRKIHSHRPQREWKDLRIRDQALVLRYAPVRLLCPACGPRVEHLVWARPWQRITRGLSKVIARLSRELSWKETAAHYGVDWKTVASAVRSAVDWGLKRRKWRPLHWIGMDEVSRSKGQRYLTLVYDLERETLIWVGENRDLETMRKFFTWLGGRRSPSIRVVCCDMWAIYLDAVVQWLPQAEVIFDRFHIVQHLNRAVDDVRRECWRLLGGEEKRAFKKTRWLWLKNPWNLKREEKARLSELCRRNAPIVRAYYLKEAFQSFWDYRAPVWGARYLERWLRWAMRSRLEPMKKFARMIRNHKQGILTWTRLPLSNGALEGMNNKVKVVSRQRPWSC